jgi:ribosomal protein S18 acetylase RimI-like enzyme
MRSDIESGVLIRSMKAADRAAVKNIVMSAGNFNQAEICCALELIDIYLQNKNQTDYRIEVTEDAELGVQGYVCWGPVPMTKGAYDLYWIATHPDAQGKGLGSALISYVEACMLEENGRLLIIETSSKESYGKTVRFYLRLRFEEASRIRDFYDVGDDKLVFVKRFSRQGDRFSNGTMEA